MIASSTRATEARRRHRLPRSGTRVRGINISGPARTRASTPSRARTRWENQRRGADLAADRIKYLQPEPYLLVPDRVLTAAREGTSMPAYAYAFNNPIMKTDPTGLGPTSLPCAPFDSTVVCCLKQNPGQFERCGADPGDCVNKCVVKGTTAYAICLGAGEPSGNCEYSANKSITGCIKNCPFQCKGNYTGGPGGPRGGPDSP